MQRMSLKFDRYDSFNQIMRLLFMLHESWSAWKWWTMNFFVGRGWTHRVYIDDISKGTISAGSSIRRGYQFCFIVLSSLVFIRISLCYSSLATLM